MRAGFIGAGKAGCSLCRYLKDTRIAENADLGAAEESEKSVAISGFYSKTFEHSQEAADDTKSAAFFRLEQVVSESDMTFITTPDSVIETGWAQIREM